MSKTRLDNTSEQNILNMLMESSGISTDQMSKINTTSSEIGKTKLETAFELNFADEDKILKVLSANYSLQVIYLKKDIKYESMYQVLITQNLTLTQTLVSLLV